VFLRRRLACEMARRLVSDLRRNGQDDWATDTHRLACPLAHIATRSTSASTEPTAARAGVTALGRQLGMEVHIVGRRGRVGVDGRERQPGRGAAVDDGPDDDSARRVRRRPVGRVVREARSGSRRARER